MKQIKSSLICLLLALTTLPTMAQERTLQIYEGDNVAYSIPVSRVDSIKVSSILQSPTAVNAVIEGDYVNLSWSQVKNATSYEIYRSGDNVTYTLLTADVTACKYTDKTPLMGTNYYKVRAVNETQKSAYSEASSPVTFNATTIENGLYMGIIGFNQSLTTKDIALLNSDTETEFTDFVDGLTTQSGTLLYYAVDEAINKLTTTALPEELVNVSIVTFTDGLDQGSLMMNSSYNDNAAYLAAINDRIESVRVQNQPITAYSIGLKGNDVSDDEQFMANLQNFASAPENATEVSSMDEAYTQFRKIAEQLNNVNTSQTFSLTIPGQSNGTKIRFTFDNVTDASQSQLYIEGVFSLGDRSLKEITYHGLTCGSGDVVVGEQEGIFVTFTFTDMQNTSEKLIPTNDIKQWSYITTTAQWQINSEFTPENNTQMEVIRKNAVIMLVLDCSSSLGTQFATMQTYAQSFIRKIIAGKSVSGPINGYEYVDLGLPSGLKWATCNVGASSPEEYGNYYAWGETTTKSTYTESNSTTYGVHLGDISGNRTYDAARANWGSTWRIPTEAEIQELVDNCTWEWTSQGGHYGRKVTGPNGNSIFLPAAGYRQESSLYYVGENGFCWSSTPHESDADYAYGLYFKSGRYGLSSYYWRSSGRSVRPVSD